MPISVQGTQITYNDSTNQGTAFVGFRSQVFAASGTFTIPTGVTAIKATACGGGGGGGGVGVGANNAGGGGPGGVGVQYFTGLTPGATLAVTVGSGGNGGSGGGNGNTGGTSSLASGNQAITSLTAPGGNGGVGNDQAQPGSQGVPTGFSYRLTSYSRGQQGEGQTSPFGVGPPRPGGISNGTAGGLYGAGGSGASTEGSDNRTGGAGAAGLVFIEW